MLFSLPSGACYAEFGVRVPHTSGSAYMYSYVSVGEFVAFVIGWNMILEYLIGTSACACALSASLDSLLNGAISNNIGDIFGTIFGRPPDFIAFCITLLMTCVLACGVSKSVMFNNVLNTINLAAWVFIMVAGMFYVDTSNWSEHDGFLPYGWSGVLSGAATCFYAFIGFDIIATTGEEAHNPQKSIPKAIVGSLIIVLIAYVSSRWACECWMNLQQILTFHIIFQLHSDTCCSLRSHRHGLSSHPNVDLCRRTVSHQKFIFSRLYVEKWWEIFFLSFFLHRKCRAIVALGAAAGLSVAMFGSMFPMPRVSGKNPYQSRNNSWVACLFSFNFTGDLCDGIWRLNFPQALTALGSNRCSWLCYRH